MRPIRRVGVVTPSLHTTSRLLRDSRFENYLGPRSLPTLAHRDLAALSDLRDANLKKTVTSSE
jgi:hypothetical protein